MLLDRWNATFVRRWHTHPRLCDTTDYVSGHSHRVTMLLLGFFPNAGRDLIVAALYHDMGEYCVADIAGPVKNRRPELALMSGELERDGRDAIGCHMRSLDFREKAALRICDKLDALLWAKRHLRLVACEWDDEVAKMQEDAEMLGILDQFNKLVTDAMVRL